MMKFLKTQTGQLVWIMFALLGILVLARLGQAQDGSVNVLTACQLLGVTEYKNNIGVVGVLKERRRAGNQIGLILVIEDKSGCEANVYVTPDVRIPILNTGQRLMVVGSVIGPGRLSITRPDGIKPQLGNSTRRSIGHAVPVKSGWATVQRGENVVRIWTGEPETTGIREDLDLVTSGSGQVNLERSTENLE